MKSVEDEESPVIRRLETFPLDGKDVYWCFRAFHGGLQR